jgi:hypothetical protein
MRAELDHVLAALAAFYARETFLLEKDAGERALTHRLAVYLEGEFPGFAVDCDYDRLGERTRLLPRGSIVSTEDHLGKSVYPDIVVHRREIPDHLLAVELRKAANHQPIEHDRHKLRALTDPQLWFAYRIGLLLTLGRRGVVAAEVYVGGAMDAALTRWLDDRLQQTGQRQPA